MKISRETLNQINQRLHVLKNTWPCGIRSVDNKVSEEIKRIEDTLRTATILDWNPVARSTL